MNVFQKIKDTLNETLLAKYKNYLLEQIPLNSTTTIEGLRSILKTCTTNGEFMYVVDTGEGLKEGYYTVIYIFKTEEKYSRAYYEVRYNFKKQRWTEEPFYNEAFWMKLHKDDRLYITSDAHEAMRMTRNLCFETWENKRKK